MIFLIAASSISLTMLQASISAPREAFRTCLKEASTKAGDEKVGADAYEAYVRAACGGQLTRFKSATESFDIGNKMSRKAASGDADATVADFLSSALDHYKYIVKTTTPEPAKQEAVAPKPAPITPQPTPASQPKP
jgi:hypothetical protein